MYCLYKKTFPLKKECERKNCKYWIPDTNSKCCLLVWIDSKNEKIPVPYEKIGRALGSSAARVHQEIMYRIIGKIRDLIKDNKKEIENI